MEPVLDELDPGGNNSPAPWAAGSSTTTTCGVSDRVADHPWRQGHSQTSRATSQSGNVLARIGVSWPDSRSGFKMAMVSCLPGALSLKLGK